MTPLRPTFDKAVTLACAMLLGFGLAIRPALAAPGEPWSDPGPHAVTRVDTDWTDAARGRTLPIRMQVPAATAAGKRPTILFSHGLGGSRAAGELWGRHWASHGFIVIHLQHPGSDEALWRNRGATPVKEALLVGSTPAAYVDRIADVKFALDEIERRRQSGDPVAARIDADRLGISGHSFGARTTLAMAGERVPGLAPTQAALDPRFKAGVALSPTAPGPPAGWPARFGAIRMPLLSITGTNDDDPFGQGSPALRTEPWRHMSPPHKYLLVLNGADHYVFSGGEVPRRRLSGHDADIQRMTKVATLRFWQAWLEGDAQAQAWLADPATRDLFAVNGTWSAK
jgi:predicted dienelactone hydrolase